MQHRPRKFGHSKYGLRRFVRGFLDLLTVKFLTGFGQRPQHLLGGIGLSSFLLGGAGLTYLAGYWVVMEVRGFDPLLHERPALYLFAGAAVVRRPVDVDRFSRRVDYLLPGRDADTYSIVERIGDPAADLQVPAPRRERKNCSVSGGKKLAGGSRQKAVHGTLYSVPRTKTAER